MTVKPSAETEKQQRLDRDLGLANPGEDSEETLTRFNPEELKP